MYDKNQGYRENLNKGMTKTKIDKKKNLNKGMTKIKIVKKIKDKCDKNRSCQEITKQSYDKNQGYQEKN